MVQIHLERLPNSWLNCRKHCWCAYETEDYPHWASLIEAMKVTLHDHGDGETCTGCMIDAGIMIVT